MVSLVNRHDGLVGVVFLVCLARVVFAGGVNRPRDVFATRAFADDDVNVVHLTGLIRRWSDCGQNLATASMTTAFAGVVSSSVSSTALRDLVFAVPNMGFGHKGSPVWCGSV